MGDWWIDELRHFGDARPREDLWPGIEGRTPRRDRDAIARFTAAAAAFAVFGAAAALTWAQLSGLRPTDRPLPGPTPSASHGGPSTYVIRGLRLRDPDIVEYRVSWSRMDSFPGVHRCDFAIIDAGGRRVTTRRVYFYTVVPDGDKLYKQSLYDSEAFEPYLRPVPGEPNTYTLDSEEWEPRASCEDERLDVGEPYAWEFSDPEVQSVTWSPTEGGYYVNVLVETRWLGPGAPGVVICDLILEDPDGQTLMRRKDWLWPGDEGDWPSPRLGGVIGTVATFGPEHSVQRPTLEQLRSASISFNCRPV
jgi:hypothetical protein